LAGFQKMIGYNRRPLEHAFFFHAYNQPDKLRHAPREWSCAARAFTKHKVRRSRLGAIPHLLWNHPSIVRETKHRIEVQGSVAASRDFVFAAFAREDRP